MIHVCFGVYDKDGRYSKFTGTAITSVFENTSSKVTVHILHDNTMTQDNHDKFVYLAGQYGQQIKFYNVEKLCAKKITRIIEMIPAIKTARVSIGALFRLLIPDIIPIDLKKLIYCDSDIIVNLDIKELWQMELSDKVLAAVPECDANRLIFKDTDAHNIFLIYSGMIPVENYFNSGVVIFNLERLRNEKTTLDRGIKFRAENTKTQCFDQDILNYCFAKEYLRLPNRFNKFSARFMDEGKKVQDGICHLAGSSVSLSMDEHWNRLFFSYFMKTPFFDVDTIGHIYDGVREGISKIQQELLARMRFISKVFSGKQRAFFLQPRNIDMLKNIFGIEEDEEIISAINDKSVNQLIDSMKNSDGKKIYIIVTENLPSVHAELTSAGFIEGKDFISGGIFFAEVGGIHTNSYQLIKKM